MFRGKGLLGTSIKKRTYVRGEGASERGDRSKGIRPLTSRVVKGGCAAIV